MCVYNICDKVQISFDLKALKFDVKCVGKDGTGQKIIFRLGCSV